MKNFRISSLLMWLVVLSFIMFGCSEENLKISSNNGEKNEDIDAMIRQLSSEDIEEIFIYCNAGTGNGQYFYEKEDDDIEILKESIFSSEFEVMSNEEAELQHFDDFNYSFYYKFLSEDGEQTYIFVYSSNIIRISGCFLKAEDAKLFDAYNIVFTTR